MDAPTEKVSALTDDDFRQVVHNANVPVLVDFWSPWCMPCRFLAPILEEAAEKYEGRVQFCKVDVHQNPGTAAKYRITSIPTLLVFRDGEPVDSTVGLKGLAEIFALLGRVTAG